jgi:hypothetical protein
MFGLTKKRYQTYCEPDYTQDDDHSAIHVAPRRSGSAARHAQDTCSTGEAVETAKTFRRA